MGDFFCTDCKAFVREIHDRTSGDTVCSECGLVLEAYFIDETSEWRVFLDSADDKDPNRVGGPTNPLFDIPVDTVIAGVNGEYSKATASFDKKSNRLLSAFQTIASMGDRLSLVSTIKDRAKEIFKKLLDDNSKSWRGRNSEAILAGCIFVACQEENLPRTLKEVMSVVSTETTKRDIGRAKVYIMQYLKTVEEKKDTNNRMISATDYVRRFCSNLGTMDHRTMKAAFEAVQTSEETIDIRRSPLSLAAAVIYIVGQLMEVKIQPNLRDIAIATGVAEGTIKSVVKELKPHLGKIVPSWFASEDELKDLCVF